MIDLEYIENKVREDNMDTIGTFVIGQEVTTDAITNSYDTIDQISTIKDQVLKLETSIKKYNRIVDTRAWRKSRRKR